MQQRRRELGLSQPEMAQALRLRLRLLQRYEAGATRPRPVHLAAIAALLRMPISAFFFDASFDRSAAVSPLDYVRGSPDPFLTNAFAATGGGSEGADPAAIAIAGATGFPYLPLMLMQEQRLVEKHAAAIGVGDLRVSYHWASAGALVADAVLDGRLHFASGGVPSFLSLWDRTRDNLKIRALRAMNSTPLTLSTANRRVYSVADFADSDRINVQVRQTTIQAVLLEMAAAQAFGARHYDWLNELTVGLSAPDGVDALIAGNLTADFVYPPFSYQELETPGVRPVTTSEELLGGPATFSLLYTSSLFADEHPRIVAAVTGALDEAIELIHIDRRAAGEVYRRVAQPAWRRHTERMTADRAITYGRDPRGLMQYVEFMHRVGRLKSKPRDWQELFMPDAAAVLDGD